MLVSDPSPLLPPSPTQDVKEFGEAICKARGGEYGMACEHEHSCCILLAHRERFYRDDRWGAPGMT